MNLRALVLVIAAIAAVTLALVVSKAMKPKMAAPVQAAAAPPALAAKPMTRVLVAKHDLAVGDRIGQADVVWQSWPNESLNPAFVTGGAAPQSGTLDQVAKAATDIVAQNSLGNLAGATVRDPILTGEPITPRKLVRAGDSGYLAVVLSPGMRAVAVPITADSEAGGFILPGDRVDVVQSHAAENSEGGAPNGGAARDKYAAQLVLTNVRVLGIDLKVDQPTDAKGVIGSTATIEVSPAGALALAKAKAGGSLSLALRSYADAKGASGVAGESLGNQKLVTVYKGGEAASFAVAP